MIYDFFLQGKYDLLLTTEILFEYLEVIGNKMSERVAPGILESLLAAENASATGNLLQMEFDSRRSRR
ncbi:MAG TPA: hypothetical protein VE978_06290 [Chitinophagales bacterium]|nr:hypothetical protein [Chitinophagales bacterium]